MSRDASPAERLLTMLDGYRVVQTLYAAAELGIADHLRDGPEPSDRIAAAIGAHERSLSRLLRALASLGIVREGAGGTFALTPLGDLLRSDTTGSLRAAVLYYGGRRHWTAWGQLLDTVRSGGNAFAGRTPAAFSEMAARDPRAAAVFNEAMSALTSAVDAAVVAAWDFSRSATVVDVGGGYGALLAQILLAHPHLRGILFDIPAVIDGAREPVAAAGLSQRCDLVAGDMFDAIPAGGDTYLLKSVVHDWSDDLGLALLRSCRRAMRDDAVLLVVERVLPGQADVIREAPNPFLSDLNMLLLSGGCERTEDEYRSLLADSGFRLRRVVPTGTLHSILEATPA